MKRVLITGANSYIGTSFENYIAAHYAEDYSVDTLDMQNAAWREWDFSPYDCVFHVAGIAHSDSGKISKEREALYYAVNTDLTAETAQIAQAAGVKQFIYMSSIIVYGDSAPIGKKKRITPQTEVSPSNCYGDSKVQAENRLRPMDSDTFRVVILRPPMIYGKNSKGNYPLLAKIARKLPVFPYVDNERSMLYVENLCEFVRLMMENEERGVFFPQNAEYGNTAQMVRQIASAHGKKITLVKGFGWLLKGMSHLTGLVNKAFGNMTYDLAMSEYRENYVVCDMQESIARTEGTR